MTPLRIALAVGAVVAVGALAYLAASPYLAARELRAAVVAQQPDALLDLVDTEAVQGHLQAHFQRQLEQDLRENNAQSTLLVLGAAMGEVMVERAAWEYGNRDAIVRTLLNGRPTKRTEKLAPPAQAPIEEAAMGYQGFGRFHIDVPGDEPVVVVMTREGLGWKVTELQFAP